MLAPALGSFPPSVPTVSPVPLLREHPLARNAPQIPAALSSPSSPLGPVCSPATPAPQGRGGMAKTTTGSRGSDQARLEPIINNKRRSIREAAVLQPGTGTGLGPLLPLRGSTQPLSATSAPGLCWHPAFSQEEVGRCPCEAWPRPPGGRPPRPTDPRPGGHGSRSPGRVRELQGGRRS